MIENEIEFDPLSWYPSPELDIAIDAVCCGGDGIVAKQKWSIDERMARHLFEPLQKQNKWMLIFTMQGEKKGWLVKDQADEIISNNQDIRLAMLRAVLKYHMSNNVEDVQQTQTQTEIIEHEDNTELLDDIESEEIDNQIDNNKRKRR